MRKKHVFTFFAYAVCLMLPALAETFRNPVRITTGIDPSGVSVADVNNDGRPDILWGSYSAASSGTGVLHTLLAQPSGGYLEGPSLTMPAHVGVACMPAEETGDGNIDIVCGYAYQFTANIYTFPGKGDGSFGSPIISSIPTFMSNGAWVSPILYPLADLNGDGVGDLVTLEAHTGYGYVMLGDGHGGFSKASSVSGNGTLQLIDVNGDGRKDLAFSGTYIWINNGAGAFSRISSGLPYDATCTYSDLDGDGKPDAVCGRTEAVNGDVTGGTQLLIYQGVGDGSFNSTPVKTVTYGDHTNETNGLGTFDYPFSVADVNADGVLDILAMAGDGMTVILGRGQLNFDYPAHYATGYTPWVIGSRSSITQIADLNGDGRPDVVSGGPNGIYISYAQKNGAFDTASAYEVTQTIGYQTVADFDEDGTPDVAATGDSSIKLSLGAGDGTFKAPIAIPSGGINFSTPLSATYARIVHGDFNGDHHQDIVAVGSSSIYQYDSYVLFGDGKGGFTPPQLISGSTDIFSNYHPQLVYDINHDGKDDLFLSDAYGLYVLLSNGDGSFSKVTTAITTESGFSPGATLVDINKDGAFDAVWVSGHNVQISKGHNDGTFEPVSMTLQIPTDILPGWSTASVTSGDFDADGIQDIAVLLSGSGSYYGPSVNVSSVAYVYYGVSDGTFTSASLAGSSGQAYTGISTADLSRQGLSDLILKTGGSLAGGYSVGILHSLPKRTFGHEVNYYAGTGLADISMVDLNHDGFIDLLFSNGDFNIKANSVTVLMNQGNPPVTGTLTASPDAPVYGGTVTLNASFVPSSFTSVTGVASFFLDGKSVGSANLAENKASLVLSDPVKVGTHSIEATWPGNTIYSPAKLSGTLKISPVTSSVSLSSTLNPASFGSSVTFTASVVSSSKVVESGDSVTFFDGSNKLGDPVPLTAGQSATFTTSSLSVGSHSITAIYSGNSQISGSSSLPLTETIAYVVGDFAIQSPTSTNSTAVAAGKTATFQFTITPAGGFNSPISFSCTGLPSLSSCEFSPSTLPSGQGQVSLNIRTTAATQSAATRPWKFPSGSKGIVLACVLLGGLPGFSKRKRLVQFSSLLIAGLASLLIVGCGGQGKGQSGQTSPGTPVGTYQVTVTAQTGAVSQNISHTWVVNLTVQ